MRLRLVLGVVPLVGAVACTAILGDFASTSKSSMGGDDGGSTLDAQFASEGSAVDGPSTATDGPAQGFSNDATTDGPFVDATGSGSPGDAKGAGPDAPSTDAPSTPMPDGSLESGPTLYRLHCAAPSGGGSRTQVTMGASVNADTIRVANLGQNQVRIVTADYQPSEGGGNSNPAWLRAYTVNAGGGSPTATASLATNSGQVFDIDRYSGIAGAAGGFVALFGAYDSNSQMNSLMVARLPDDASTWVGPVTLAAIPNDLNDAQAVLTTINAARDDYYVAFSSVSGATQTISGAEVTPSETATLPVLAAYPTPASGSAAYGFAYPGIAFNGVQPYVILSPNGSGGPPPLGTAAAILIPGATPPTVLIAPPSNLNYFAYGLTNATAPGFANVFFLVADLTQIQGDYRVGRVAMNALGSLNPMSLPETIPLTADGGQASIKDLIINNQTAHWENASGADQLLVVAPPADLVGTDPGVNFGWWDAPSGMLRALSTGDAALLSDVPNVHRGDATFISLVGSIAQFWMVYESVATTASTMNNFPPPPGDIWVARVTCSL